MSAKLLGVICWILIRSLSIDIDNDIIVCMANINTPATQKVPAERPLAFEAGLFRIGMLW